MAAARHMPSLSSAYWSLPLVLLALHHPFDFAFHYRSTVITAPATRIPLFILAATLIAGVTGNLIFQLRASASPTVFSPECWGGRSPSRRV